MGQKIIPFLPEELDGLAKKQGLYKEREGYVLHQVY